MLSAFDNYIHIAFALIVIAAVVYVLTRRRSKKKVGNAPTGTNSRASQIGRRVEENKPAENKKQPARKWGRGAED